MIGRVFVTERTASPVGVHSLDHFTLGVPDLDEAERFYLAFGLDAVRTTDRLQVRTFGGPHVWADLVSAPRKKLLAVRFGIFEADAETFARRLAPLRMPGESNAIWLNAPDGLAIELAIAAKTSPDEKSGFEQSARFSPIRGTGPRSTVATVRPRRLAHLALFTANVSEAIKFYESNLGLRLSDRSGDDVAFMHGMHGSEHHMIALARSEGPGLHHCSWDVGSIAEVGQGAMQMMAAGADGGWGVGRHVLGSNYFYYARDPWGSYAEYSADMDYIPAGAEWISSDTPPEDSFYQWGPPPPHDFGTNHEAA